MKMMMKSNVMMMKSNVRQNEKFFKWLQLIKKLLMQSVILIPIFSNFH